MILVSKAREKKISKKVFFLRWRFDILRIFLRDEQLCGDNNNTKMTPIG
jgi:hypothetical protein